MPGVGRLPAHWQHVVLNNRLSKYVRTHVALKVLLPLAFVLLLFGVTGVSVIGVLIQSDLEAQLLKRGILAAHTLQAVAESSSTTGGIQRYVASMGIEEDIEFAIVVAGNPPRVIAATELTLVKQLVQNLPDRDFGDDLRQVIQSRKIEHYFGQGANHSWLDVSAPVSIFNITENGLPLGEGALMIHISMTGIRSTA